jgi:adenosylmethionine-8-amino-7-oxononanoate aminotransferase
MSDPRARFQPILPGEPPPLRPTLVRGEGVHVWDVDGHRYLDGISGTFCVQLGYGREDLVRAMKEAAERIPFARPWAFESEEAAGYARELLEAVGAPYTRAIFTSSGSEAVEAALKAAFAFQRAAGREERTGITRLRGHFHGSTLQALAMTDYAPRRAPYERLFAGAPRPVDPGEGSALERSLAGSFALLAETVPGAALGVAVPSAPELARMRRACDEAGALWILDEVLTGVHRTGRFFAWQRLAEGAADGAVPDIVAFGKGAGGGYAPLGGILLHERVASALDRAPGGRFMHAQTYGAHAVACAVGRRVLAAIAEEKIQERVLSLEGRLRESLEPLRSHDLVREVRGLGFLWGIVLRAERGSDEPFPRNLRVAERVEARCRERGVLVFSGSGSFDGERGDHILIAPPLVAETHHFPQIAMTLRQVLDELGRELRPPA